MQINWFEILIQIINFFILLALLNKFLFKPVMAAMEKREDGIADTVTKAELKFANAEKLVKEYEVKISESKSKEEEILNQAKIDADEKREVLLTQYREEMRLRKQSFESEFNNEKTDFIKEFRRFLANYTVKISKKLLMPVSNTELEDKVFEGLLNTLADIEENILEEEKKVHKGAIHIQSSNIVSDKQKSALMEKISNVLNKDMSLLNFDFQIDSNLIYGYKIVFNTFTVNENLNFYLEDLEEEVAKQQKF